MVSHIDLRINDVNPIEISNLSTLIDALKSPQYHENVIPSRPGRNDFVVTVKPAGLQEIKEALRLILRIVEAERVEIEP